MNWDWIFVFQMMQGVGQVGAAGVALYAVHLVQRYTRRKDGADFLRNRWNEQAQLNHLCIQNEDALIAHETVVYGVAPADLATSRRYFIIFSMLNQMQHLYIAQQHGVLNKAEFEEYAIQIARLLKRDAETVEYLLAHRAYSRDFGSVARLLLQKSAFVQLPLHLNEAATPVIALATLKQDDLVVRQD